jgi:hypothetical protein
METSSVDFYPSFRKKAYGLGRGKSNRDVSKEKEWVRESFS